MCQKHEQEIRLHIGVRFINRHLIYENLGLIIIKTLCGILRNKI